MRGRRRSKAAVRPSAPRRQGRGGRWLRVIGWTVVLLGSLALVTWRQTKGLDLERALREIEAEREIVEAEGIHLVRRIEELRSRARIVRVARERLRMHLPQDDQIVFLPAPAPLLTEAAR